MRKYCFLLEQHSENGLFKLPTCIYGSFSGSKWFTSQVGLRVRPFFLFLTKRLVCVTSRTEADPNLLANYVAALLKNNKPKKDLEALCINQLLDFLGDGMCYFGGYIRCLEELIFKRLS